MSGYVQDKAALYVQILRLWSSFSEMQKKYGKDALSDQDLILWAQCLKHPACQERLRKDE